MTIHRLVKHAGLGLPQTDADGGLVLPGSWRESEAQQQRFVEGRMRLYGKALWAFQRNKEEWGRRLYHGEGIPMEDWPEMQPLTPAERTTLLRECKRQIGMELCTTCPRRADGIHLPSCKRKT